MAGIVTERRIVSAAQALFEARGAKFSLNEVAGRIGTTERRVRSAFSKADLLDRLERTRRADCLSRLRMIASTTKPASAAVRAWFDALHIRPVYGNLPYPPGLSGLEQIDADRAAWATYAKSHFADAIRGQFRRIVAEGLWSGEFRVRGADRACELSFEAMSPFHRVSELGPDDVTSLFYHEEEWWDYEAVNGVCEVWEVPPEEAHVRFPQLYEEGINLYRGALEFVVSYLSGTLPGEPA